MTRYCPLGTPSLLNGDFWENVARLKDFSWSVLLSSNPTNLKAGPSIGSAVVHFVEDNTQEFLFYVLCTIVYATIYTWICYKFISCLKIVPSRKTMIFSLVSASVLCITCTGLLVFHRLVSETVFKTTGAAYMHMGIAHFFFHKKWVTSYPSSKGFLNFRSKTLIFATIIISILIFLFTPSIGRQGDTCPSKVRRVFSEFYFWTTFMYIYMSYCVINYLIYTQQADVLYIWKDTAFLPKNYIEVIGQEKKKKGFGWIKDYYNEPLVDPDD